MLAVSTTDMLMCCLTLCYNCPVPCRVCRHTLHTTLQPDSLATLLSALRSLGCELGPALLGAASDVCVANMGSFSLDRLVELLQVGGWLVGGGVRVRVVW